MTDETMFATALEKADPAERAAFLAEACGGDTACRNRVEGLLMAHARAVNFLERSPVAPPDPDHGATQALTGTPEPGAAASQTTGGANGAPDDEALTFLAPPTLPNALGRLGHYEVLQVLGRGGFGIVFRAFDEVLQRVVALKVMTPQLAATSPARKRFLREARSSAQVRHENVVQVYEVADQPLPYLAMEFIPGETLQQKLDRTGPLDVPEVLRIGRQIAEGLAAAHAMDLIHRDIKPGNVLLEGGQHKVKITDFGLARTADDASVSQSGIIAGTPMYMAPEQAQGRTLDQRADLFSLGSVLYQIVAGRPPFRANSAVAVLKRVAEDTPRAIREIIPEAPQWLCDIIAKLQAKDPDDRYQSAREVADVLADCEAQLKAHARLKDYSRIPSSKPQRSGRWKWLAATAVLLLPVIVLVVTEIAGVTHLLRHSAPTPDPDRQAAEYVLSIGGQVQVDDRDRKINAAAELPRDPFRLTWVGLMHSNQVSETGLANFKGCKNLTFLGLFDTSVSDEGLANFQNCTKLTFVNLSRTKIGDAGLANFKNCTDLTIVVLSETKVSDSGLAYLKNSTKLTKLLLQKTKVTAAGIEELQKALPLCKIEWDGGVSEPLPRTFTDADLRRIAALPAEQQVEEVRKELVRCNPGFDGKLEYKIEDGVVTEFRIVTDKVTDIAPIRVFDALRVLDCSGTWSGKPNGLLADLTPLQGMNLARLNHIDLRDTKVTDAGMVYFRNCKDLRYLYLSSTKVTDAGLAQFKDCKNLTVLWVSDTQIGDPGMVHFQDCKALRVLNLAGTGVSDAGLAHFKNCKALKSLYLDRMQVGDAGLAQFKGKPLTLLAIFNTGITDLSLLEGMPLEHILLTPRNITKGLDMLRDMKSLKTIGIAWQQSWPAAEFWERYDQGEFKE